MISSYLKYSTTATKPCALSASSAPAYYESTVVALFIHKFHCNTMLFNYCSDREKEGTLVLASYMYVHGLTVIINQ